MLSIYIFLIKVPLNVKTAIYVTIIILLTRISNFKYFNAKIKTTIERSQFS